MVVNCGCDRVETMVTQFGSWSGMGLESRIGLRWYGLKVILCACFSADDLYNNIKLLILLIYCII